MVGDSKDTLTHRLVLPGDANHHGTLYAGSLLRIALEAAYTTAYRLVGCEANLVLRRVLDLQCYLPVPIGSVVEIRGAALHIARAAMVVGLFGSPFEQHRGPWMDGLMSFAQIDAAGRPAPFPDSLILDPVTDDFWHPLKDRMQKLLHIR